MGVMMVQLIIVATGPDGAIEQRHLGMLVNDGGDSDNPIMVGATIVITKRYVGRAGVCQCQIAGSRQTSAGAMDDGEVGGSYSDVDGDSDPEDSAIRCVTFDALDGRSLTKPSGTK
jgi:hypothetical protein